MHGKKNKKKIDLIPIIFLLMFVVMITSAGDFSIKKGLYIYEDNQADIVDKFEDIYNKGDKDLLYNFVNDVRNEGYELCVIENGEIGYLCNSAGYVVDELYAYKDGTRHITPKDSNYDNIIEEDGRYYAVTIDKKEDTILIVESDFTQGYKTLDKVSKSYQKAQLVSISGLLILIIWSNKKFQEYTKGFTNLFTRVGKLGKKDDVSGPIDILDTFSKDRFEEMMTLLDDYKLDNERKEEELLQFLSDQDMLLKNMSHEIKTPLSIVKLYLGFLVKNNDVNKKEEWISIVNKEVDKVSSIIDETLIITKQESGVPVNKELIDLSKHISDRFDSFKPKFDSEGIKVTFSTEGDSIIEFSPTHLDYIINNYITNAMKYSLDKKLDIKLVNKVFSVSNLTDVSEDSNELLWGRYFRMDESRTDDTYSSVGLGLPIVKSVAESNSNKAYSKVVDNTITFVYDFETN